MDGSNLTADSTIESVAADLISLSLVPRTENATQSTSSDLTTDTGGIHAAASWAPRQLKAVSTLPFTSVFQMLSRGKL